VGEVGIRVGGFGKDVFVAVGVSVVGLALADGCCVIVGVMGKTVAVCPQPTSSVMTRAKVMERIIFIVLCIAAFQTKKMNKHSEFIPPL
jgi:hypothetical protein